MKFFFLFFFLYTTSLPLWARGPAVEPQVIFSPDGGNSLTLSKEQTLAKTRKLSFAEFSLLGIFLLLPVFLSASYPLLAHKTAEKLAQATESKTEDKQENEKEEEKDHSSLAA